MKKLGKINLDKFVQSSQIRQNNQHLHRFFKNLSQNPQTRKQKELNLEKINENIDFNSNSMPMQQPLHVPLHMPILSENKKTPK